MRALRLLLTTLAIAGLALPARATYLPPQVSSSAAYQPNLGDTFSTVVSHYNNVRDFLFGTGSTAAATGSQIPIANTTQLAAHFNSCEDFTGTPPGCASNTENNDELERYMPFSSTGNFVFTASSLALTGTLDSGGNVNPVMSCQAEPTGFAANTSIALSTAGSGSSGCGSSTTGLFVGEVVEANYTGAYVVSALTSTNITLAPILGAPTTINAYALLVFTPYSYATLSASSSNATSQTLTFAAVPSGVAVGQFISVPSTVTNAVYSVASKTSTTVVVTSPAGLTNLASGTGIFFGPPIRSAEIWSQDYYQAGAAGTSVVAIEATVTFPADLNLHANWNAGPVTEVPTNSTAGAWPAIWLYQGNNEVGASTYRDASELDLIEIYDDIDQDGTLWSGTLHYGSQPAPTVFFIDTGLGTYASGFGNLTLTGLANNNLTSGQHKIQMVWTPTQVFQYVDGRLFRASDYQFGSPYQEQIGIDLAIGAYGGNFGQNLLLPVANATFASGAYALQVSELKVWTH